MAPIMLKALKRRKERKATIECLCAAVSDRARAEVFFSEFQVPDTFDGRFDMLVLHAWLVLDELRGRGQTAISQHLIDALFVQFDLALRELGAGDVGMSRRMKKMAGAFFGRLDAYRGASNESALAEAIARNVYRGEACGLAPARLLATYCLVARARIAGSDLEAGLVDFGGLPSGTS
jgi:cytochrome b pre-mRNA-processing protein 3